MTVLKPLTEEQTQLLSDFLTSQQVNKGCLDFIAMHGFLTGIATGPETLVDSLWLAFLFDGEPAFTNQQQKEEIESLIHHLAKVIQRTLYLGEQIALPCALTASIPDETNELTDWCFGFIEAIAISEDEWFSNNPAETIAELLLPAGLLSEQFISADVEHLTKDKPARQQLAENLIESIQNLYLLYRE